MSTTVLAPILTDIDPHLRYWTRGEFDRMLEANIFAPDEGVDLYDALVHRRGEESPRLWTREEYHQLIETGILGAGERVELIEGEVFEKVTNNPPHTTAVGKTADALRQVFRTGFLFGNRCRLGFPFAQNRNRM